jgi:hypothetical protein
MTHCGPGHNTAAMTNSTNPVAKTTPAFFAQAVTSFALSCSALVVGIAWLPVGPWVRAFLAICALYTVSSAFTLAKCIRDRQEEAYLSSRVDRARVDKLLAEHDPFRVEGGASLP